MLYDPSSEGSKEVTGCTFVQNIAHSGAGIDIRKDSDEERDLRVLVQNCLLAGNSDKAGMDVGFRGAGIAVTGYSADIINCTIVDNVLFYDGQWYPVGGGISFFSSGTTEAPSTILNCIIRGNEAEFGNQIGIATDPGAAPSASYVVVQFTDVAQGQNDIYVQTMDPPSILSLQDGNIDSDPEFALPGSWNKITRVFTRGDYHLKSLFGRWNGSGWAMDGEMSPCIDAGSPESEYSLEPQNNGERVNLGFYGNTAEASKSTTAPVISNIIVTDNGDGTATVGWTTSVSTQGRVDYGLVSMAGSTPNTISQEGYLTSHSIVLTGITAGANYKIVIVNDGSPSPAFYWPLPWPIEGDANQDCRVNILDLIFIRNKLNQPVGTGDNWKADLNIDARINILDLIYVRGKLNTSCP